MELSYIWCNCQTVHCGALVALVVSVGIITTGPYSDKHQLFFIPTNRDITSFLLHFILDKIMENWGISESGRISSHGRCFLADSGSSLPRDDILPVRPNTDRGSLTIQSSKSLPWVRTRSTRYYKCCLQTHFTTFSLSCSRSPLLLLWNLFTPDQTALQVNRITQPPLQQKHTPETVNLNRFPFEQSNLFRGDKVVKL